MNRYLIFRTDRIGDFLISLILIKSIKNQDNNSHITIVASEQNFEFIKSFNTIDDVIILKKNLIDKFNLISFLRKNKFDYIISHDGKNRSKFISFFLKSKNKYYSKIKNFSSYIEEIKFILNSLNLNFTQNDLNTLNERNYSKFNVPNYPYILVHFDEKWIFNSYIKEYTNIEPTLNELEKFLISLSLKLKKKIIITTGIITPAILTDYVKKNNIDYIRFIDNLNFENLEAIINSASLIVSCHGAVSHIAAAKNIKQIDIIDKTYNYKKWTEHFRNYKSIDRKKFNDLYKDIVNLV